jgi:ammonia channel protein AmtB
LYLFGLLLSSELPQAWYAILPYTLKINLDGTTPWMCGEYTVLGTILLGVFATSAINPAVSSQGLIFGETSLFLKQLIAVAGASAYAFIFTYLMLAIINLVTPVRVSESDEILGLDDSLHGEKAYDSGSL